MSATSWAAAISVGTPVKWRALEVAAFEPYPAVQEQLDPAGKYGRVRHSDRMRRSLIVAVPLGLLIVALFIAPIVGFALLLGSRFGNVHPDPVLTIPAAGILFAAAFVFLLISLLLWLRSGRPKDDIRQYQAGIALVLGVLSAMLMVFRGRSESVPGWQPWLIPVIAATVLGLIFTVLLVVGRRSMTQSARQDAPGDKQSGTVRAGEPLRRVAEQIGRLSADQQATVRADIAAAVRDLAHRGVISAADGDWALGADLGKLALRMSQSRKRVQ